MPFFCVISRSNSKDVFVPNVVWPNVRDGFKIVRSVGQGATINLYNDSETCSTGLVSENEVVEAVRCNERLTRRAILRDVGTW